jgi:hypothetical protein
MKNGVREGVKELPSFKYHHHSKKIHNTPHAIFHISPDTIGFKQNGIFLGRLIPKTILFQQPYFPMQAFGRNQSGQVSVPWDRGIGFQYDYVLSLFF